MKNNIILYLSLGLILLSNISIRVNAAVMGIDYGAQWFKVALVKPGVPLDLVLNRESKRKTPSNICIRDGVRLYGTEANNLVSFDTELFNFIFFLIINIIQKKKKKKKLLITTMFYYYYYFII